MYINSMLNINGYVQFLLEIRTMFNKNLHCSSDRLLSTGICFPLDWIISGAVSFAFNTHTNIATKKTVHFDKLNSDMNIWGKH